MILTVFAKKRTTNEGKVFYSYLTRLTKKDGTEITTTVKFRDTCGNPKPENCPCNIVVEKGSCNFNSKEIVNESTGEIIVSNTLWVSEWRNGERYVDTSMDEFM